MIISLPSKACSMLSVTNSRRPNSRRSPFNPARSMPPSSLMAAMCSIDRLYNRVLKPSNPRWAAMALPPCPAPITVNFVLVIGSLLSGQSLEPRGFSDHSAITIDRHTGAVQYGNAQLAARKAVVTQLRRV